MQTLQNDRRKSKSLVARTRFCLGGFSGIVENFPDFPGQRWKAFQDRISIILFTKNHETAFKALAKDFHNSWSNSADIGILKSISVHSRIENPLLNIP
jgi:hypothetical protein